MTRSRIARRAMPVLWVLGTTLAVVTAATEAAADPFIPTWQPDGRIRLAGDAADIGDNVHNDTGADQTRKAVVRPGRKAKFIVRYQHDGKPIDDTWVVTGAAATPGFRVTYESGGADVTAAVTAGTFQQTVGSAGLAPAIKTRIKAKKSAPPSSTKTVPITARSLINDKTDTVRAVVRVK
jgi:hypothetical protein